MKPYRVLTKLILAVLTLELMNWVIRYGSYAADTIPMINEICTNNFSVAADPAGSYLQYIELYNPNDEDYTMDGLWMSNDRDLPQMYDMSGITVPAEGYVIIWLVDDDEAGDVSNEAVEAEPVNTAEDDITRLDCRQYYCPFDLSRSGDYLYICNSDNKILESIAVPAMSYNIAYGRVSDGSGTLSGMEPSPGVTNDDAQTVNLKRVDVPTLSVLSGFYDEPFDLQITSPPGTDIYYTLDGTTPTTESMLYEGPIRIEDPSDNPNVYSAHDDVYLNNYTPEEPVDKAAVVRAIAVDRATGAVSNVVAATYFVGFEDKSVYDGIAVVSLITDPDNLYDYDAGLYVMGATYDEYIEKGGFGELTSSEIPGEFSDSEGRQYFRYMYTNAEHHGREWERETTVMYYDSDHNLQLIQTAGMRIAGESSRHLPHKSLNLITRSIYGSKTWQYQFWNYDGKNTVRLRASAGEEINWKETFMQSLNEDRDVAIQHSIPCAVFMDGEYWGLYQLTEQYDTAYFQNYYGIDDDDLMIYKNHTIVQGDQTEGMDHYDDLEEIITTYDMSADHLYEIAEQYVDMDSLIDYFCALTYLNNQDITAHHNQEMWRNTTDSADIRWHYALYDLDMTGGDPACNTIADYETKDTFYWPMYLCANESFKQQYVTTMMDLANVEYSYQRVHARLGDKAGELEQQMIASKQRYESADYDADDYAADVADLDTFFRERRSYIEQYLADDLGLGDIATVTVTNSDPAVGAVKVNSSILTSEDYTKEGTWSGEYFTDYDITLTAAPAECYTFAGWTGDIESTDATITVSFSQGNVNVEPVFVPVENN